MLNTIYRDLIICFNQNQWFFFHQKITKSKRKNQSILFGYKITTIVQLSKNGYKEK